MGGGGELITEWRITFRRRMLFLVSLMMDTETCILSPWEYTALSRDASSLILPSLNKNCLLSVTCGGFSSEEGCCDMLLDDFGGIVARWMTRIPMRTVFLRCCFSSVRCAGTNEEEKCENSLQSSDSQNVCSLLWEGASCFVLNTLLMKLWKIILL